MEQRSVLSPRALRWSTMRATLSGAHPNSPKNHNFSINRIVVDVHPQALEVESVALSPSTSACMRIAGV